MRLLVIQDDPGLARLLEAALTAEGHVVDVAETGQDGFARATRAAYEIVVVDLLLRDVEGLDLLHRLRQEGISAPIIAVGAKSGAAHVVRALDAGADEYVAKPVSPDEVAARIRALIRRAAPVPSVVLVLENLTLNVITHGAFVDGRPIRLTPKEFSLLHHFLRRQGEAMNRAELLEKIWGTQFDPGSNVVDVHISRLRGKLQQAGARVAIESVRGAGFVLLPKTDTDASGEHNGVA